MAGVTRVNGLDVTVGTLYQNNAKGFLVTVKNTGGTAIDLRAEDDAVDEAGEMVIKEINPLMYLLVNANTGIIHMICDPALSASDIQARIRALGSAVGPNNIDVTGTTAAAVTGITLT